MSGLDPLLAKYLLKKERKGRKEGKKQEERKGKNYKMFNNEDIRVLAS